MPISVAIITKNEEKNIKDCLETVKWADEIIIVDNFSTDQTIEICKKYGAKIYSHSWDGFGIQKNRAIEYCHSQWILSLDADERISPQLANEIKQILKENNTNNGYQIPRKSMYCGKFINHSDWSPDYVLRLFQKKHGQFNNNLVHESLQIQGEIGKLKHPILHLSFENFESVVHKMNFYSSEKAKILFHQQVKSSLSKALYKSLWTFLKTYIFKLGFLDGKEGFMLATSNAQGSYYCYVKLWFLNKQKIKMDL